MSGELELKLRWNFKVPYTFGVLIHLKIPKSKTPTKKLSFSSKRLNLDFW
jgi:hypothetical protein